MVTITGRVFDWLTMPKHDPSYANGQRAYAVGPVAVEDSDRFLGHDQSVYHPDYYANYLATSNAVYAVSKLRANLLADLPLKLYKVKKNGDRVDVTAGELYELLHKVNPYWTFTRLIEMIELSLCLWGAAYLFVERGNNGRGTPRELWWARPDRVKVIPDPVNYIAGFVYEHQGRSIPFRPSETIWLRYANPIDEYSGLSPLAAARLSADVATAAMKSNRGIFSNGMQAAGFIAPRDQNNIVDEDAARRFTDLLQRRFSGVDNAHRWVILAQPLQFEQLGFSPKDAEFLGAIKQSLEDVARAYGVPLDLVGGQRTYENVAASERIIWAHTIRPEARFIAAELTEQLLPMFPGQADLAEFDFAGVAALHESEDARWLREQGQLQSWVLTINEWRTERGLDPVDWGDVPWGPLSIAPLQQTFGTAEPATDAPALPEMTDETETDRALRSLAAAVGLATGQPRKTATRLISHDRVIARVTRRCAPWERKLTDALIDLTRRQRASVQAGAPFDPKRWIKLAREQARPLIAEMMTDLGGWMTDELGGEAFAPTEAKAMQAVYAHTDRLARSWNLTLATMLESGNADRVMQAARDAAPRAARTVAALVAGSAALEACRQANAPAWPWLLTALAKRANPDEDDPTDAWQDDGTITPEDVADALRWWDDVMPAKYRGLLDAKIVDGDEGE